MNAIEGREVEYGEVVGLVEDIECGVEEDMSGTEGMANGTSTSDIALEGRPCSLNG